MRSRAEINREIARLQEELAAIPERPKEPEAPRVVFFQKKAKGPKPIDYTAVRPNGGAWLIFSNGRGQNPAPRDWEQLLDFVEAGEAERPEIMWASEVVSLDAGE